MGRVCGCGCGVSSIPFSGHTPIGQMSSHYRLSSASHDETRGTMMLCAHCAVEFTLSSTLRLPVMQS